MDFSALLSNLSDDLRQAIEERAAIMEYDGNLSRYIAEAQALRVSGILNPDPIGDVLSVGAKVTACRLDKKDGKYKPYRPGDDFQQRKGFYDSIEILRNLQAGIGDPDGFGVGEQFSVFRWEPGTVCLCVFDLDRNHENGGDGVTKFISKLPNDRPNYLSDIEAGTHPAYALTPSGGMHLFFTLIGKEHYGFQTPMDDVEFFHFGSMVNAPGSVREGKPYRLFGTLQSAPPLPSFLRRILRAKKKTESRRPYFSYNRKADRPSFDRIFEWAETSPNISGRNRLCWEFALRASRYGYPANEVESYLSNHPVISGHRQIRDAVLSAFKIQEAVS